MPNEGQWFIHVVGDGNNRIYEELIKLRYYGTEEPIEINTDEGMIFAWHVPSHQFVQEVQRHWQGRISFKVFYRKSSNQKAHRWKFKLKKPSRKAEPTKAQLKRIQNKKAAG